MPWTSSQKNRGKRKESERRRLETRRDRIVEVKKGPCKDCGGRFHHCAMDFDHLDPRLKLANVSKMAGKKGWDAIAAEIAKCDLVCANCHRVRTFNRGQHSTPEKVTPGALYTD